MNIGMDSQGRGHDLAQIDIQFVTLIQGRAVPATTAGIFVLAPLFALRRQPRSAAGIST